MRILIFNTDYPSFLKQLYQQTQALPKKSFVDQLQIRNQTFFGISDAYPYNLRLLGHQATELHVNNVYMQRAWAKAHKHRALYAWPFPFNPVISFLPFAAPWYYKILEAQIEHYKPDVTINHALAEIDARFLRRMKSKLGLLVGQIAAPYPADLDFSPYDLMLSSLPNYVQRFEQAGLRSRLFRLGFDPRTLEQVGSIPRDIPISFVGSISAAHARRTQWLEKLCEQLPVKVWGQGVGNVPRTSAIAAAYQGPAWGLDMYRILARSQITLNMHINISENHANNMRLYEATGMGTLLLTDAKKNLTDMFTPDREVMTYTDTQDCIRIAQQLLNDPHHCSHIALAGQQKTLQAHNYQQRIKEFIDIVEPLLP